MKRIILIILTYCLCTTLVAQTYEEAINQIKVNNIKEAQILLDDLQKSGKDNNQAYLVSALLKADRQQYLPAFYDFQQFYKNQPNPYPYLYAMFNSGIFNRGETQGNKEVIKFLQSLIDDPKAPNCIKASAIDFLGTNEERMGNFKNARGIYASIHDIKNWSTLGVFENLSGSGFNKDFGAVAHPEASYAFTNKNGAEVHWFEIPEVRNDRWWDMNYNHYIIDAVIYCQTFVKSDEDKEVQLLVGVSGSMKVWVNDFLVASESEERNTDADVYTYKVKLQKGYNRLLIQTGSSELERNNFMVRLAGADGELLTNVKSEATYQPYIKAKPYEVVQLPLFAELYFEALVAKDPDNLINQLLLLQVYNHNEKKFAAHKTVAKLKQLAPHCTLISEKVIETANIDDNIIDATRERENIKTNDPESLIGLTLRFGDAYGKENWEEAITLLNRHMELYGKSAATLAELIAIYNKQKDMVKLQAAQNEAVSLFPNNGRVVQFQYYLSLAQSKDVNKANKILDNYLETNYDEDIMDMIIEFDLKTGKKKDAIAMYEQQVANKPFEVTKYAKIALLYYEMHDYDNALEWINKLMKLCPYIGKFYYSAGLVYNGKGEKGKAIEQLRKCIIYSPTNYDAREKLRTLEGKKKLHDYFQQNDAVKIYKDAQANVAYAKEEAVILINDERQIVYPEHGAGEEQVEMLVYINSQSAIQRYKEYYIQHNNYSQKLVIDKAELLKKDGSKVPAERNKGYIVFSTLAIGDAIHLYYKLESSYDGKLAEHFWNDMYFNSTYPTHISRYSLILPSNKHFDQKLTNPAIKMQVTDIDDYKLYTWEENDLPKVATEPLMNYDVFDRISVSSIPDWNYVANWYSDVSNIKTQADFDVKEKVKELMAGNERKTELEKAKLIYNYIENNYNYSNVSFLHTAFTPQRASRTMSTKLGDCKDLSTLFVSMCREAGLDANLVLVRTNGSGNEDIALPSISFNHCIAQLHTGSKNYLVELTNNHLSFSTMGSSIINARGLFIPKDGAHTSDATLQKLNTPDKPANMSIRNSQINLTEDNAVIHRVVNKIGAESANFRYYLKDLDEEERLKKLTETISEEFGKNIKIENLKIEHLNELIDTITLIYDVKVNNFNSTIAGMKVFRIPWTDAHQNEQIFSLDSRKYPLNFSPYSSTPLYNETISFTMPKGKKLVEVPKNITLSCTAVKYSLTFKIVGDVVTATREVNYLKDEISPAEYPTVKDIISKIHEADNREVAYK